MLLALTGFVLAAVPADLPSWRFDSDTVLQTWVPNGHLSNVKIKDGAVAADATDWDPFFTCRSLSFPAGANQYVVLQIKADKPGSGQLFWSGKLEGKYGGLNEDKATAFHVAGDSQWHDVVLFPFWHTEGTIRQLRLDVYQNAHFEIRSLDIRTWGGDANAQTDVFSWNFAPDQNFWQIHPAAVERFAPPLRLPVADKGWVAVRLRSSQPGSVAVLWAGANRAELQSTEFAIRPDANPRTYNVEMHGLAGWDNDIVAFGLRLLPEQQGKVQIESITIGDSPSGPPDVRIAYFGFENAVNRTGRACRILAQLENKGGSPAKDLRATLNLPKELRMATGSPKQGVPALDYDDYAQVTWDVLADTPGQYTVTLAVAGQGAPDKQEIALTFLLALNLPKADYVPPPQPVQTDVDLCAYYFPGWDSDAKWDCVRNVAPIRKPLLGYYDEGNPECVDWQIKWSVENGIKCYLVDWYWVAGKTHLMHWIEAYKKARYRDHLQIAIMWANHNPPKTHSPEDWRKVTQFWIDEYFPLKSYYRIDGKPAVFIWSSWNIRNDLGGSEAARKALDESQKMAKAAGYPGITFVAMNPSFTAEFRQTLLDEGYVGCSTYHEWGKAVGKSGPSNRGQFEDVVKTSPQSWEEKLKAAAPLTYYPDIDTGWDSRPWHGDKGLIIFGRTAPLFETLLREAKAFCEKNNKKIAVLGPLNEWGEGSYIEPCTEYGFDMLEAIRRVFAKGAPKSWPVNLSPADVGRGPYDYPRVPGTTAWTFDQHPGGWNAMMGVSDFRCQDGAIRMRTTSADPAISVSSGRLKASAFPRAVVRMQFVGTVPESSAAQLFWTSGRTGTTEAASIQVPLKTDGKMHEYVLNLAENPRWRGTITSLRFDPCSIKDVEVVIDHFEMKP